MEPYESKLLSLIENNNKIVIITAENRVSLRNIPEKLNLSQNTQDLDVGVRAILEHLAKKKNSEDEL